MNSKSAMTFTEYIRESAVEPKIIRDFVAGRGWAKFDTELGYLLNNYFPRDGLDGCNTFSTYDELGARTSFHYADRPARINTYGNSFTQCHQVSDGETWQEYLAAHLGEPIRNFGIGGFGVYQAYRRMIREESGPASAPNIIFYIWGDDHVRSLLRCRYAAIYRRFAINSRPHMFHGNFWCNIELDTDSGQFVERENMLPTVESLTSMTAPDWLTAALQDDMALQLLAYASGQVDTLDIPKLELLAQHLGFDRNFLTLGNSRACAGQLLDRYSMRATMYVLDNILSFARREDKRIMVVLFDPYRVMSQWNWEDGLYTNWTEPVRNSLNIRYDQDIVHYLERNQVPYFDMNNVHQRDFQQHNITWGEYMKKYFIGHYNPSGNHFFAFSIKDTLVNWLDPRPITYRDDKTAEVDFRGYLPGH